MKLFLNFCGWGIHLHFSWMALVQDISLSCSQHQLILCAHLKKGSACVVMAWLAMWATSVQGYLRTCQLTSFRSRGLEESKRQHPRPKPQSFCNIILEVTSSNSCHILLVNIGINGSLETPQMLPTTSSHTWCLRKRWTIKFHHHPFVIYLLHKYLMSCC